MAYMSKDHKKEIAVLLKEKFGTDAKKRGFNYSLKVENLSTIVMTIQKGSIDFLSDYTGNSERGYLTAMFYNDESFTGKIDDIFKDIMECLNLRNYDNTDLMTDYFDTGHYVSLRIGTWEKPYIFEEKK